MRLSNLRVRGENAAFQKKDDSSCRGNRSRTRGTFKETY